MAKSIIKNTGSKSSAAKKQRGKILNRRAKKLGIKRGKNDTSFIADDAKSKALLRPYKDTGAIDVEGVADGIKLYDVLHLSKNSVYAHRIPKSPTRIYAFDIESWSKDITRVAFGFLLNHNKEIVNDFEKDQPFKDLNTFIVQLFKLLIEADTGELYRIYAHNGERFDWLAVLHAINSTLEEPLTSLNYQTKVFSSADKKHEFDISIEVAGLRSYVQISYKKKGLKAHEQPQIQLVDSRWHLSGKLSDFGSKGITPKAFMQPKKWCEEEKISPTFDSWHREVNLQKIGYEYCIQDCEILIDALGEYTRTILELSDNKIYPLAFFTCAGSAKATFMLNSNPPKIKHSRQVLQTNYGKFFGRFEVFPKNLKKDDYKPDWLNKYKPVDQQDCIVMNHIKHARILNAWTSTEQINVAYKQVQFGGRTEVFANMVKEEYKFYDIDANSLYPSAMFSMAIADPGSCTTIKEPIVGKKNILNFLGRTYREKMTGAFEIETAEPIDNIVKKYPVFPFKYTGDHDQLLFPSWKGKIKRRVTGEELRLFLETTSVKDDDIEIVGGIASKIIFKSKNIADKQSVNGSRPWLELIAKLYSKRQSFKDFNLPENPSPYQQKKHDDLAAWNAVSKILLNSGYGSLGQMTKFQEHFECTDEGLLSLLHYCKQLNPIWIEENAAKYEKYSLNKKKETALNCLNDSYVNYVEMPVPSKDHNVISVEEVSSIESFSMMIWSAQVLASARVALYRGMLALFKTGDIVAKQYEVRTLDKVQLLYCDTDSLQFALHPDIPEKAFFEELRRQGANVHSTDLGSWKIEDLNVDKEYADKNKKITSAIFLAAKNYSYIDDTHVLATTVKGIPSEIPHFRPLRCGFGIRHSSLISKDAGQVNILAHRDSLEGLEGYRRSQATRDFLQKPDAAGLNRRSQTAILKRSFDSLYDSTPLVFEQPSKDELIEFASERRKVHKSVLNAKTISWIEYMQYVVKTAEGKAKDVGLQAAISILKKLKIKMGDKDITVDKGRKRVLNLINRLHFENLHDDISVNFDKVMLDLQMIGVTFEED